MTLQRALPLALAFAGCTGTDIGNPGVDVDFALYDSSPAPPARAAAALPPGIVIAAAWVAVDLVRLRPSEDCDGGAEIALSGPFAVDLLDPEAPPALRDVALPAQSYCRFELRWDRFEGARLPAAPPELTGASVLVIGSRGDGTGYVLRSERNDELRLEARGGAFAVAGTIHGLVVGFDAAALFDGLDIDSAEVSDDGLIHIEPGANDQLLAIFDSNLADAAKLFDDDDGDGALDAGERDDADVLAD